MALQNQVKKGLLRMLSSFKHGERKLEAYIGAWMGISGYGKQTESLQIPREVDVETFRGCRYDVGVFGLWYGNNYGSILTYFGLVRTLESMGMKVCLIANPRGNEKSQQAEPTQFAVRQGFVISRSLPMSRMYEYNLICDTFIVGSDQLWNPGLSMPYGHTYFLDFVAPERKRIAYGTSFGKGDYRIPEDYKKESRAELARFDAVSVRDDFSRKLLADDYGCEAVRVLDPALLCDPEEYRSVAKQAKPPVPIEGELPDLSEGGYILAYILDPDEQTGEQLGRIAEQTGLPMIVMLDMYTKKINSNQALFRGSCSKQVYVLNRPHVEQWLFCFAHADCVLTDSFHGTLFSLVFQKDFVAIPNRKRGKERFTDALQVLGLTDRILPYIGENPEEVTALLMTPVHYDAVNAILQPERERSAKWLYDALTAPKTLTTTMAYDLSAESERVRQRGF